MTRRRKSDKVEGRSFGKADLLRMTARMAGVRWDVTEKVINCLFAALRQYIMDTPEDGRIRIQEFGTFLIDKKEAYEFEGISAFGGPRERIFRPAMKRIRFKPCGVLEDHCKSYYGDGKIVFEEASIAPDPTDTTGLYNPSTEEIVSMEESVPEAVSEEPAPKEKDIYQDF